MDKKFVVEFYFDYGAGGCLWAKNDLAHEAFGFGPIDRLVLDNKNLDTEILFLIDTLDKQHSSYLNPNYPPDPSLWTQNECDEFNSRIELLLNLLRSRLSNYFEIVDGQVRYTEDKDLARYLKDPMGFKRTK